MRPMLLILLLALGLVASVSAAAVPALDDDQEIANDLDSDYNPDEDALESTKANEPDQADDESEYTPESTEPEAKKEPTASERSSSQSRSRRHRAAILKFLRFLRRIRQGASKSTPMSTSRGESRSPRDGRLIRRLQSLARLLDGLSRSTVDCGGVDKRQRRSLNRWAKRLRHFLPSKNSTAATDATATTPVPAVESQSLEEDEADQENDDQSEYY